MQLRSLPLAAIAAIALPSLAQGQLGGFGNPWVGFELAPSATPVGLADTQTEVGFGIGDLDRDGWTDVVLARGQPFAVGGKRTNVLLKNVHGNLVDASQLATSSDVLGDLGFLTPTSDRSALVVDVDGDGWLDVVISAHQSEGSPKHISHPRVYRNLGHDAAGNWLGLRFENHRIPQLFQFTSGLGESPNFNCAAGGDFTADGFLDLFFADHDVPPSPGPAGGDAQHRLLVSDGAGQFVDQTLLRISGMMWLGAFPQNSAELVDLNDSGLLDLVSPSLVNDTGFMMAGYNDPANPGFVNVTHVFHAYHTSWAAVGDLNNDGRPDIVLPGDGQDRFRFNLGTDALGRAIWDGGPGVGGHVFSFIAGSDDGAAGRAHIADLDGDGWKDVLVTDVDFYVPGFDRRMHIYHNRTEFPGQTLPWAMIEEKRAFDTGWVGAVGLLPSDLRGTYDVAVFDADNDADPDLLLARGAGTFLWKNTRKICQKDLGGATPGGAYLSVCGDPLAPGKQAKLKLEGASSNAPFVLAVGFGPSAIPLFGGTLVVWPIATTLVFQTGPGGVFEAPVSGGPTLTALIQAAVLEGPDFVLTNAVRVLFGT